MPYIHKNRNVLLKQIYSRWKNETMQNSKIGTCLLLYNNLYHWKKNEIFLKVAKSSLLTWFYNLLLKQLFYQNLTTKKKKPVNFTKI